MSETKFYYTDADQAYDYSYVTTATELLDKRGKIHRLIRVTDEEAFLSCQVPRYCSGLHTAFALDSDEARYRGLPDEPYAGSDKSDRACDYCGANDPYGPMTHMRLPDGMVCKHCRSCSSKAIRQSKETEEEMKQGFALRYEAWENVPARVFVIIKGEAEFVYDGCWQAKGCGMKSEGRYYAPPSEIADAAEELYATRKEGSRDLVFLREDLYRVPGLGWTGPRYKEALKLEAEGYVIQAIEVRNGYCSGYRARKPNQAHAK